MHSVQIAPWQQTLRCAILRRREQKFEPPHVDCYQWGMIDTIAAISTAFGEAAISVLRLSGPESQAIAEKVFRSKMPLRQLPARTVHHGRIVDGEGPAVDDVLLTIFLGPASYTGEDVIEISCHGGILVTRRIYELLLANGARGAEPGEFTQRAFLNGKMDLTQAEAVMDLIHAQSELSLQAASQQLEGRLGRAAESIREDLVQLIAHVEAYIDFPDEDIDPDTAQSELSLQAASQQLEGRLGRAAESIREDLVQLIAHVEAYIDFPDEDIDPDTGAALELRMESIHAQLRALLDTAEHGRILRSGARTVICGAPNVGKSSLLNSLTGCDRAIVSPQAGTTRDTIEEVLHIHGLPFVLVDTAGLRSHTRDFVESEGIERTRRELERADVVIEVVDGSQPLDAWHRVPVPAGKRGHLLVLNKADLGVRPEWNMEQGTSNMEHRRLSVSCETGAGIEDLRASMRDAVWSGAGSGDSRLVAINARHQRCFQCAAEAMEDAAKAFEHDEAPEIIAFELREALQAVGEVTGRVDAEEVLGAIFSRFCIGK